MDLTLKRCGTCKQTKLTTEFHKSAWSCKPCANERARRNHHARKNDIAYIEAKRSSYLKEEYGLTAEEYDAKLAAQGNVCAICGVPLMKRGYHTHLDHDHVTGDLRDFLCSNHNRGLGSFDDNPEHLRAAADYIEKHKSNAALKARAVVYE